MKKKKKKKKTRDHKIRVYVHFYVDVNIPAKLFDDGGSKDLEMDKVFEKVSKEVNSRVAPYLAKIGLMPRYVKIEGIDEL